MKRILVPVIVIAVALTVVLVLRPKAGTGPHEALTVSQDAARQLPQRAPSIPQLFIGKDVVPPTNKWFSALAFSTQPQPVFAYPLSFKLNAGGYGLSSPPVVSSSNAIFASHIDDVVVQLGTPKHLVHSYDDLSVLLDQLDGSAKVTAQTRITHGSPFVFTTLQQPATVTVASSGVISPAGPGAFLITIGERHYGVYSGAELKLNGQVLSVNAQANDVISVFALPDKAVLNHYLAAAMHPITSTSVSYDTNSSQIKTTYHLGTKNGTSLFAATPSMKLVKPGASAGVFTTLLGAQPVYAGTDFTDVQPAPSLPSAELPLGAITSEQRADLTQKLQADAAQLNFVQTDSYFGGKELYRAANLLQLAVSLKQTAIADGIKTKLAARLGEWLDPSGSQRRDNRYFYYDSAYKGVVGSIASYGSEGFNDHHFHYGYFIYAAAVLSRYDQSFYKAHAAMVDVLISDIASSATSSLFPKLRVFDAYVGHSWASGNGDFGDGNNQESSSEAANAWYGSYLWSQVSGNAALASESSWLYAHETQSARNVWLAAPKPVANGPGYNHATVGIVWGGKVDYSTFFSPRPQAILGIQLIPMSPGQDYLRGTSVNKNITDAAPIEADLSGQFNDYLVMYQALSDPAKALRQAAALQAKDLDNGNSLAYLYAYLYSHQTTH